jgi:hypothetical protein
MSTKISMLPNDKLVWWPELEMGWHPATPISYQEDYWEKYVEYDATKMGEALTRFRCDFVRKYWKGDLVDIGIGAGRFVQESGGKGFDVNKSAIKWLKNNNLWSDPYESPVDCITCWDSLEHIPKPEKLLAQVKHWVFVSIPIFTTAESVIRSKHYRPGEHIWYFTERGLIQYMAKHGFALKSHSDAEIKIGREDIKSYAFCRES